MNWRLRLQLEVLDSKSAEQIFSGHSTVVLELFTTGNWRSACPTANPVFTVNLILISLRPAAEGSCDIVY